MLDLRIGILLGIRQLRRVNMWSTILIVVVITFTFINLIAVHGILIGMIDGALTTIRRDAFGDIMIEAHDAERRILNTSKVIEELKQYNQIEAFSPRYSSVATIEAGYQERHDLNRDPDIITVKITGVDPTLEDKTTQMSNHLIEGSYFDTDESGYIILGKYTLDRYSDKFSDAYQSLASTFPGDTVRLMVDGRSQEFIVKGIVDSKVDTVALQAYMPEKEFRRLFNRADYNAESIAIRLQTESDEFEMKRKLLSAGIGAHGIVEVFSDNLPKYITDIQKTFGTLGVFMGTISIGIACITVFIVIFINTLGRRRQIGILKAIGISERSIVYAYMTQAGCYAATGGILGILITLYGIAPYFDAHPIDFPYGDISISINGLSILIRSLILLIVTLAAGFIASWFIIRQDTLNAILGRK